MEPFQLFQSAKGPSLFLLSSWQERYEELSVGFSGRSGGSSKEPWSSLNIGLHVGDHKADVLLNRQSLTDAINWPFEAWTSAEQIHGNQVYQVTVADRGKGRAQLLDAIAGCDAIMTNVPNVLLTSFYADCVPLYFYDPHHSAAALAHAGWKGTVGEIAVQTLSAMNQAYGSEPGDIIVAIGPSIGECCYEVDGPVITEVENLIKRNNIDATSAGEMLLYGNNGKAHINLKEINRQIMIKAGILPIHIELTQWCTGCRKDLFYSHRMEGGLTGRMASWIGIRRGDLINDTAE